MLTFKQYIKESSSSRREANAGREKVPVPEGSGVKLRLLKNPAAAKAYSAGTKWCTKGEDKAKEYLERGPLLTIEHGGRKYLMHSESKEFMDEANNPVEMKDLHPEIHDAMYASDHPEVRKANIIFGNPKVTKATSEYITNLLQHTDDSVVETALKKHSFTDKIKPKHIDMALQHPNADVRYAAIRHPNATEKHINIALNDPDVNVRMHARIRNKRLKGK